MGTKNTPADFVIGNQVDQTSSTNLRKLLTVFLEEAGYSVSNNHPFCGGFITRHFSELPKMETLQLEIRYNQYIEDRSFGEEVLTRYDSELFSKAQERLETVFEKLLVKLLDRKDLKNE
ncbi:N-formylglutamate amidohydrolase [Enterococcus raffinosus]|uniref:N-formylglutamate amidohydrolase n=1 Tax=Enterococcus raffinosus TaxID=71452 RepID=UPI00209CEC54|nr:N-formylglutamate amidohydrolase [Enterococcus raffinosus]